MQGIRVAFAFCCLGGKLFLQGIRIALAFCRLGGKPFLQGFRLALAFRCLAGKLFLQSLGVLQGSGNALAFCRTALSLCRLAQKFFPQGIGNALSFFLLLGKQGLQGFQTFHALLVFFLLAGKLAAEGVYDCLCVFRVPFYERLEQHIIDNNASGRPCDEEKKHAGDKKHSFSRARFFPCLFAPFFGKLGKFQQIRTTIGTIIFFY